MPLNPWLVDSIEAFSFYCCPECVFRSKEEDYFQAHALQNHVLSRSLFLESSDKSQDEIKEDQKQQTYSKEHENNAQTKKDNFENDQFNESKVKDEIDEGFNYLNDEPIGKQYFSLESYVLSRRK